MKYRNCSWPDCPCGMGRWMGSTRCLAFRPTFWMQIKLFFKRTGESRAIPESSDGMISNKAFALELEAFSRSLAGRPWTPWGVDARILLERAAKILKEKDSGHSVIDAREGLRKDQEKAHEAAKGK